MDLCISILEFKYQTNQEYSNLFYYLCISILEFKFLNNLITSNFNAFIYVFLY